MENKIWKIRADKKEYALQDLSLTERVNGLTEGASVEYSTFAQVETKIKAATQEIADRANAILQYVDQEVSDAERYTAASLDTAKKYSDDNLAAAKTYSDHNLGAGKAYTNTLRDNIENGTTIANKARCDEKGNKIVDTYATKNEAVLKDSSGNATVMALNVGSTDEGITYINPTQIAHQTSWGQTEIEGPIINTKDADGNVLVWLGDDYVYEFNGNTYFNGTAFVNNRSVETDYYVLVEPTTVQNPAPYVSELSIDVSYIFDTNPSVKDLRIIVETTGSSDDTVTVQGMLQGTPYLEMTKATQSRFYSFHVIKLPDGTLEIDAKDANLRKWIWASNTSTTFKIRVAHTKLPTSQYSMDLYTYRVYAR